MICAPLRIGTGLLDSVMVADWRGYRVCFDPRRRHRKDGGSDEHMEKVNLVHSTLAGIQEVRYSSTMYKVDSFPSV